MRSCVWGAMPTVRTRLRRARPGVLAVLGVIALPPRSAIGSAALARALVVEGQAREADRRVLQVRGEREHRLAAPNIRDRLDFVDQDQLEMLGAPGAHLDQQVEAPGHGVDFLDLRDLLQ